jgi:hypothetical protein
MLTPAQAVQIVHTLWKQQIKKFPPPDEEWSEIWCATFTQHNIEEGIRATAYAIKQKPRRFRATENAHRYCFGVMRKVLPVQDSKAISDAKNAAAMADMDRKIDEYQQRTTSKSVAQHGVITI